MLALASMGLAQAADAESGLEMLERGDFGLVLMDLRMPGINGLTAIRKLRARADGKARIPIIVVTAELTPGVKRMCEDAGADGFLTKPVSMAKLFETVGAVAVERGHTMVN